MRIDIRSYNSPREIRLMTISRGQLHHEDDVAPLRVGDWIGAAKPDARLLEYPPPRLRGKLRRKAAFRAVGDDHLGSRDRHGFPGVLTSFVGRAQAVAEIAGQLDQDRLVTVTGPGGAGKTRLAAEVAKMMSARFADGVWLAELAGVRDLAQVPAAVATALGIRDLPSIAAADALARALARRQLLLVLDNCEHLIGAAAELCGRLLLGADDVRVLATSREPLRIAGEVRYRLGPLTLPDLDDRRPPEHARR